MFHAFCLRWVYAFRQYPVRCWRLLRHLADGTRKVVLESAALRLPKSSVPFWWVETAFLLLDLLFVPDLYETATDFAKRHTRPLTGEEVAVARRVFGTQLDYRQVRIDEKAAVACRRFHLIYVSFHTINAWGNIPTDILIHELVHVWQYRHLGAVYIPRALRAQRTLEGYNYGGTSRLKECLAGGGSFFDFNLEQQADIVADYFRIQQGKPPHWGSGNRKDLPLYKKLVDEAFAGKKA